MISISSVEGLIEKLMSPMFLMVQSMQSQLATILTQLSEHSNQINQILANSSPSSSSPSSTSSSSSISPLSTSSSSTSSSTNNLNVNSNKRHRTPIVSTTLPPLNSSVPIPNSVSSIVPSSFSPPKPPLCFYFWSSNSYFRFKTNSISFSSN